MEPFYDVLTDERFRLHPPLLSVHWRSCNLSSVAQPRKIENVKLGSMSDGKPAPQNIQDAFLNTVRREKATVTIHLVNGAKLLGKIRSFDKFSVLLESGSQEQLIFKHAISTISQAKRFSGDFRSSAEAGDTARETADSRDS